MDGNTEGRRGSVSVFNGPDPEIRAVDTGEAEVQAIGQWVAARREEGVKPEEIGVFVRSAAQLDRARSALERAGVPHRVLDDDLETPGGLASICTMHLAKGLEFRTVAVMACDDEVIPLQERIEAIGPT